MFRFWPYFHAENNETDMQYFQWTTVDGHVTKQQTILSQLEAVTEPYDQLKPFSRHVYDGNRQHAELRQLKANLRPGEIILHEDFPENYAIKYQNEIQTMLNGLQKASQSLRQ